MPRVGSLYQNSRPFPYKRPPQRGWSFVYQVNESRFRRGSFIYLGVAVALWSKMPYNKSKPGNQMYATSYGGTAMQYRLAVFDPDGTIQSSIEAMPEKIAALPPGKEC